MLEKLITRVHNKMNILNRTNGFIKFIISRNSIDNDPIYEFEHTLKGRLVYYTIRYGETNVFCKEVNEHLDKLEVANYRPKFKVGDVLTNLPEDTNFDIKIIFIENGYYIYLFLLNQMANTKFEINYKQIQEIDKFYKLKE